MIRRLSVKAFKGLREFAIEPQNVNLLIGANGTGKTNFADLILFIALICQRGLNSALEEFGGLGNIRTRQPGKGTPFKFQIEFTLGEDRSRHKGSPVWICPGASQWGKSNRGALGRHRL